MRNIEVVYTADWFKDAAGASGCTDQFKKHSIQNTLSWMKCKPPEKDLHALGVQFFNSCMLYHIEVS